MDPIEGASTKTRSINSGAGARGSCKPKSDELRATGRAILLLIEEIEALHVDMWKRESGDR
jgi:hypothetical protein